MVDAGTDGQRVRRSVRCGAGEVAIRTYHLQRRQPHLQRRRHAQRQASSSGCSEMTVGRSDGGSCQRLPGGEIAMFGMTHFVQIIIGQDTVQLTIEWESRQIAL